MASAAERAVALGRDFVPVGVLDRPIHVATQDPIARKWTRGVCGAGLHAATCDAVADVCPNGLNEVPRFGVVILECCIIFLYNCLPGNLTEIEYMHETKTGEPRKATICIRPAAKAAGTAHR